MLNKTIVAIVLGFIMALASMLYWQHREARHLAESNAEYRQAVELVAQREARVLEEKLRLQQVLEERQIRERVNAQRTQQLREQINALSNDCTLSDDASRLLQQIYERHRTM